MGSSSPASQPAGLCYPPSVRRPIWISASLCWQTAASTPTPKCTGCSPRRSSRYRPTSSPWMTGSRRSSDCHLFCAVPVLNRGDAGKHQLDSQFEVVLDGCGEKYWQCFGGEREPRGIGGGLHLVELIVAGFATPLRHPLRLGTEPG